MNAGAELRSLGHAGAWPLLPTTQEPVASLTQAYRQVLGEAPAYYRKNAYCDTIRFPPAVIPSVTFGPAEDGWPPPNEYIHPPQALPPPQGMACAMSPRRGVEWSGAAALRTMVPRARTMGPDGMGGSSH